MSVEPAEVPEGASGMQIRWVIDQKAGAPNFAMRVVDIAPAGFTPLHKHEWEHEMYVIQGEGTMVSDDGEHKIRPGDAVFVPGGDLHQVRNMSGDLLRVMCLIPNLEKNC